MANLTSYSNGSLTLELDGDLLGPGFGIAVQTGNNEAPLGRTM